MHVMDRKFRSYDEIGSFPNLRIYLTPEAQIWYNSEEDLAIRETFVRKIHQLSADIREVGYSRIGKAKAISSAGTTLFYLRLTDAQRILYHFRYEGNSVKRKVIIYILSVSNKTNFQKKLLYSAQQKVHASAWDDFNWDSSAGSELNLEECDEKELQELEEQAMTQFNKLPESDKKRNFSRERFIRECERSTIYEFRIPLLQEDGFDFANKLPEILKLQEEQDEMLRENKSQFLLEGVAGTGKTTILFYRLVSRLRTIFDDETFSSDKCVFVTHNSRLRDQVRKLLSYFFANQELEKAKQCIRTVDEEMKRLIKGSKRKFLIGNKLTRDRFKGILRSRKVDLDLFWEEYRGVLRGYNLHGDSRILPKEKYIEEIGRRRGQIKIEERYEFYEIALKIEAKLATEPSLDPSKDGWDDLDLCKEAHIQIQQKPSLASLDFLYIDEVQDLTTAELEIFLRLLNPNGLMDLCVAGDLSQSVQPSAFTWQSLRDLIYRVHDIQVDSEYRLDQNFRSTPYLVDAANDSLELISTFRNEKVMNLQRPFGGTETRGEPIRLFRESESELIGWMKQNKLPNEWCVILVRDEVTKHHLESVLDEGSKEFVETIAKFKGLEERNILLWDPTSGSDRILDLLYHPNRGKEAKARPWNLTTAVIELKYLFVALTRARYLLGIFLPNTTMKKGSVNSLQQHFYASEFVEKECYNESDIQGLGDFAEADFDEAQQMERGYEFANAGQYKMASATFRNANRIDLYHHYLGLHNAESGEYCDAIMAWSNTLEGASTDHNMRDETKKLMAKHASSALEDETNEEGSNEIEIAIKIHAADLLGEKATSHLNAKLEERRKNYVAAAELYLNADLVQDFKRCLSKVQGQDKRSKLLCLNGQYKDAEKLFRLHLKNNNPALAIGIALEPNRFKEKVFIGALLTIYDRFEAGDISWAKEVSRHTGNKVLIAQINEWEIQNILSVEKPDKLIARNQFKIYLEREQYSDCREVLQYIPSETERRQKRLQIEWKEGGFVSVMEHLAENLSSEILENIDSFLEHIPELDRLLKDKPNEILKMAIKSNISKSFDDSKSTSLAAQRLIVISLLMEYMDILKHKDVAQFQQFRIKVTDLVKRRNQPIIRGCASLLLAHAVDEHHPIKVKVEPYRIIIAMIEMHHFGLRKADVGTLTWFVAIYSLHNHFKSEPKIDDLNTSFNSMHSRIYSEPLRKNLLTYSIRVANGKYNTTSFSRLPNIVSAGYEDDIPYFSALIQQHPKMDLPKARDLGFFPLGIKKSGKLVSIVHKDLKWFAYIFKNNEIFSTLWDSVFVDGEERGDLGSFMDALPEHMYEPDEEAAAPENQDENNEPLEEDDISDSDDNPTETPIIEDVPTMKEDLEDNQPLSVSSPPTVQALDLNQLISTTASEYNIPIDVVGDEIESIFYSGLEKEIEGEDNSDGSLTIDRLKTLIDNQTPETLKKQGDRLNRLFNQVFTMPWSNAFKFACMLVFNEKKALKNGDVTYIVLNEIDLQLFSKFAANFDIRRDVLNSKKSYSQRIFNVT
tara:strand:+ start:314 stop:4909 length:4596 start_codon:yes stop_codon:yes gene_type:complete